MARAGPRGNPDLDSLGDCSKPAQALEAASQALPADAARRDRALLRSIQARIEQSAQAVCHANDDE